MKKRLKIWLIVWWSLLVVWWAWAWLTKAWIIPNWIWIEILCSEIKIKNSDVTIDYEKDEVIKDNENNGAWNRGDTNIIDALIDEETKYENRQTKVYVDRYDKPIIYIYPTERTEINVKLWTPKNLLHTYPKYNSEKWWNIVAQPNGDLEDMDTWRKLYALYREWKTYVEDNFEEWFVVKWEDIVPFLEEKLALLWLNEREAEEFIVYWLPQMEGNKYNLIRFETKEEQDENMLLNITPTPDTVIRVMMDWKAIDEPINIPEQRLITPERNGFTVVEWWGSPRN